MDADKEKMLLENLYDRLFDAICYVPSGKAPAFDRRTTFIQFSKNEALNPNDFRNMMSPVNPDGDMNQAYYFSQMVDQIPNLDAIYAPSGVLISKTYRAILGGANTNFKPSEEQQKLYKEAYDFLNQEVEIKGKKAVVPSDIAVAYDDNQGIYIDAVTAYRSAELELDMKKPADQKKWQVIAPKLKKAIDQAWNQWTREGKEDVEKAQSVMRTTINNAVGMALSQAKEDVADEKWFAGIMAAGSQPWLLSYAIPSDWTEAAGATEFKLKSDFLDKSSSATKHAFDVTAKWNSGLWSVGIEAKGEFSSSNSHMDANNLEISAKLTTVQIMRPWFNPLIFTMENWYTNAARKNGISNGNISSNVKGLQLPLVPTAFVLASDVEIKAEFSKKDEEIIRQAVDAKANVGWGPFSIGGSYSYSHSEDKLKTDYSGGKITIPGIQIIAWINTIIPPSPPMDPI